MTKRLLGTLVFLALGCGSSRPVAPAPEREMRATEHRDAAALHAARAAELARLSDGLGGPRADKLDAASGLWFRSPSEIVTSPLQRSSVGWLPKPDGIIVLLSPAAGPPQRLLEELRCHRAWIRLGEAPDDKCPLELPEIDLVAYGDKTGISVEITLADPALVPELQRRTAYVVETKRHPR